MKQSKSFNISSFLLKGRAIRNGDRERLRIAGSLQLERQTDKKPPNKGNFPKVWDVGEHKRKINTVCGHPRKDIFVHYIDHNEKIHSNSHEKSFKILWFW